MESLYVCKRMILNSRSSCFGPTFNSSIQYRFMKPLNTAQTRLENRTTDLKLDRLVSVSNTLSLLLQVHHLMSQPTRRPTPAPYLSLQYMSRWKNDILGPRSNRGIPQFLRKYPHVFQCFTPHYPVSVRVVCCRLTVQFRDLIREEDKAVQESEFECVIRIKKLILMSVTGTLHVHALGLIRRDLGLPLDFRVSILAKYAHVFRLINLELVALVHNHNHNNNGDGDREDQELGVAAVIEKWREKQYREKWLSEFETKYAFPINLPTGFKIERGFREEMKNWQRLQYLKPYDKKKEEEVVRVRVRTCGGVERFEKRAVGILHELLSLTIEKMVDVERLAHFKKDFGMEKIKVRELVLKHPGIFYISTKGTRQLVFLREAYSKGCLMEPNPIYDVRRKMISLILLGGRNTRELKSCKENKEEGVHSQSVVCNKGTTDGDWIIPILKNCPQNVDHS